MNEQLINEQRPLDVQPIHLFVHYGGFVLGSGNNHNLHSTFKLFN